jgi:hypothetical protein
MEPSIKDQLEAQGNKIDAIYVSVEKTRKYFLIILWATVIMFVLPMIGLVFIIPSFIEIYTSSMSGLLP